MLREPGEGPGGKPGAPNRGERGPKAPGSLAPLFWAPDFSPGPSLDSLDILLLPPCARLSHLWLRHALSAVQRRVASGANLPANETCGTFAGFTNKIAKMRDLFKVTININNTSHSVHLQASMIVRHILSVCATYLCDLEAHQIF